MYGVRWKAFGGLRRWNNHLKKFLQVSLSSAPRLRKASKVLRRCPVQRALKSHPHCQRREDRWTEDEILRLRLQ